MHAFLRTSENRNHDQFWPMHRLVKVSGVYNRHNNLSIYVTLCYHDHSERERERERETERERVREKGKCVCMRVCGRAKMGDTRNLYTVSFRNCILSFLFYGIFSFLSSISSSLC